MVMYLTWLHSNELPLLESSDESIEVGEVVSMVSLLRTCIEHLVGKLLSSSSSVLGAAGARVEVDASLIRFSTSMSGLRQSIEHMVGELVVVAPVALICCTVACSQPVLMTVLSPNVVVVAVEDEVVAAAVVVVDGEGVGEASDDAGEVGRMPESWEGRSSTTRSMCPWRAPI